MRGIIVRAVGGFFDVRTAEEKEYRCRARGRFKKSDTGIYVGDYVRFTRLTDREGVLEEIEPRRSLMIRPPIANINQVVIVCAPQEPPLSLQLLDRLLVLAANQQLRAVICINKTDLLHADLSYLQDIYVETAGCTVLFTSAKYKKGIEQLKKELAGYLSVFAGQSGAGKSSLLNSLQLGLKLKTGRVSTKSKRGRHTTRHVELIPLPDGGFVADSPGFSQLKLTGIKSDELDNFFPEFVKVKAKCRFLSCMHAEEPDCAVKAAVEAGIIARSRYEHYLFFLNEIREQERSF
ncbi:MAG: ribosome small subunit-dependent GTPase A [Firmicutes bacterium]|nr:ribosome small subunit-dependent GTPase A [Bacillota bacterium]